MSTGNEYWAHGMSHYAVRAYTAGLVPASKVKGVPAVLVKKFCSPKETHVTSGYFNKTNFYDPYEVRAIFGLDRSRKTKSDARAVQALADYKNQKKNPRHEVLDNCVVEWVEYIGRQHFPQAITKRVKDARVEIDGNMALVTLCDGSKLRKRLSGRGFRFWKAEEKEEGSRQLSFSARL